MQEHEGEHKFLDDTSATEAKSKFYLRMIQEAKGLLDGENDFIANSANISSLIYFGLNARNTGLVISEIKIIN